jgi:hypothetical protein
MDEDAVNVFAKQLADAIAAAYPDDPGVKEVRAKASEAGFDMKVTLEAVVGFVERNQKAARIKSLVVPPRLGSRARTDNQVTDENGYTNNDLRFLGSLKIGKKDVGQDTDAQTPGPHGAPDGED